MLLNRLLYKVLLYLFAKKKEDKALEMLKHHKNEFENQLNKKIKAIKSNKDGEYKVFFSEFYS
jgi:glutathione peroxidase-family protein